MAIPEFNTAALSARVARINGALVVTRPILKRGIPIRESFTAKRFGGILANRGQKTVIGENGKPKVVGTVGVSAEIQKKIKKEDWNSYHIVANGNHFVHKINGVVTCEATDEDDAARNKGLLALQLHAGPPMLVQFRKIQIKHLPASKAVPKKKKAALKKKVAATKKVAFVAGTRSHGYGSHEHYAGCMVLARRAASRQCWC